MKSRTDGELPGDGAQGRKGLDDVQGTFSAYIQLVLNLVDWICTFHANAMEIILGLVLCMCVEVFPVGCVTAW